MALFVVKSRNLRVISIILLALRPLQAAPTEPENAEIERLSPPTDEFSAGSGNLVLQACLTSHEQAQLSKFDGQFFDAEQHLLRCSKSDCPAAVRSDCATWRGELIAAFPSIVVRAHGDQGDIEDAQLYIDGKEVDGGLRGKALRIDPGVRMIRVVLKSGEQQEQRRVLSQGEKSRLIVFDFGAPIKPALDEQSDERPSVGVATRPVPLSTFALGSLAVGAGAFAIGFGVDALHYQKRAEEECAPLCPDSVSDRVERSALISDVSLGISAAAAVGALLFYLLRPTVYERQATHDPRLAGFLPWGNDAVLDVDLNARLAGLTWVNLF